MIDWDDAYANMAHVAGSEELPARWASDAAAYRASGVAVEEDIPYGPGDRQKLDIVWPDGTPKGLAVFVHGGYWMRLCKSDWTHYAEGARTAGWAVGLPGYTLAPAARIAGITQEILAAVSCAADRVRGPIRLAGHSAGGHLVTRLVCTGIDLPCIDRIEHVLSISGLYDLRPLQRTRMNETLCLDLCEARDESPALLEPTHGARVTAWVGGDERPEFIRQTELLQIVWSGLDASISRVIDEGHHHFSVINELKDTQSPITRAFLER